MARLPAKWPREVTRASGRLPVVTADAEQIFGDEGQPIVVAELIAWFPNPSTATILRRGIGSRICRCRVVADQVVLWLEAMPQP